jgi:hypothetical protein
MFQFTQNETNGVRRRIFFYASAAADGYTPVTTGLSTSTLVQITKNGVTPAVTVLNPTFTHISNGLWFHELTQALLDTVGVITVTISDAVMRPVQAVGYVYSGDPLTSSTAPTAADIWSYATRTLTGSVSVSGNVTVGGFTAGSITNAAFGAGAITSTAIANSAITLRLGSDPIASNARYVTYDSFSGHPLLSTTNQHQVAVTGSNHAAADIHQFQPNVLTATATDTTFVSEIQSGLSAPTAIQVADAVLNRNLDSSGNGTDTLNERTVRSALRAMRNKVSVASGVMTVTKEDDTATAWTASLSNTANVTVDPT